MKSCIVARVAFVTLAAGLALAVACAGDMTGPNAPAIPAHGLLASLAVPGRCLFTCDPVSAEFNHVGLITLTNTGSANVFVRLCGPFPAVTQQEFVNGQWLTDVTAASCVNGPVSALIAAHDSLQFNEMFAAGTRRVIVSAASDSGLATEAASTSAAVVIR